MGIGVSRFLLDTATLIDASKGIAPTRTHIVNVLPAGDELGVCAVIVTEFEAACLPLTVHAGIAS